MNNNKFWVRLLNTDLGFFQSTAGYYTVFLIPAFFGIIFQNMIGLVIAGSFLAAGMAIWMISYYYKSISDMLKNKRLPSSYRKNKFRGGL
jgi:hypothetical protein